MYEKINKIEEGTYGVVFRAKVRETGCDCCRHDIIDIYQLLLQRDCSAEEAENGERAGGVSHYLTAGGGLAAQGPALL